MINLSSIIPWVRADFPCVEISSIEWVHEFSNLNQISSVKNVNYLQEWIST